MRIAMIDQLAARIGENHPLVQTLRQITNLLSDSPGTFVYGAQQTHALAGVLALPPGLGAQTLTIAVAKPGIYVPKSGRFTRLVAGFQSGDPANTGILARFTVRTPAAARATSDTVDCGLPSAVVVADVDVPVAQADRVNVSFDPQSNLVNPMGALSAILV